MSRYVIGDVHGQYDGLMQLLEECDLNADDTLYFLGDLIDRGSKSSEVVEWVINNNHACIRGNHEQMCIEAFDAPETSMLWQGWLANGGAATLESYGDADLLTKHLQWMRQLPLYMDLDTYWLVHAGVDPNLTIEDQTSLEFCWIREPFHCSPNRYFSDKTIITGHTITFVFPGVHPGQIAQGPGWLGIDTGAYHPKSGWLSALNLDTQVVHQYNVYHRNGRSLPLDTLTVPIKLPTFRRKTSSRR
ncbi:metallophosphoesterase [Thalassoporum mexicanum PCC 7367]|uniref:metallophosphoesterase family protein n=1 Tax=Thalassoporum mexicanum TaxID=3457544 RepID=UPI00029F8EE7|nr:metallophosphoesterase family protein [Pseudanabaena sp. PCC 7367]AFY71207.1 metallophosphoesterase [Pseudanabaena sp. PCC 7367]